MLNKDYKEMLQLLLENQIDFLVVGAYAMAAHGYPRATGDIDIWVKPDKENSKKIFRVLQIFGAPMEQMNEHDFEKQDTILQIGVAPRRIDIITGIDGVQFDLAVKDKITVEVDELKLPIISLDNLVKNKLSTGREKDQLDANLLLKRKKS